MSKIDTDQNPLYFSTSVTLSISQNRLRKCKTIPVRDRREFVERNGVAGPVCGLAAVIPSRNFRFTHLLT